MAGKFGCLDSLRLFVASATSTNLLAIEGKRRRGDTVAIVATARKI